MIKYYKDGSGYVGIDTSQHVRGLPGILYGRCAVECGVPNNIEDRVWSPVDLKVEVPKDSVPEIWIRAIGLEVIKPKPQPTVAKASPTPSDKFVEGPNLLPGRSYLVDLPGTEEELNRLTTNPSQSHRVVDVRYTQKTPKNVWLNVFWIIVILLAMGLL